MISILAQQMKWKQVLSLASKEEKRDSFTGELARLTRQQRTTVACLDTSLEGPLGHSLKKLLGQ